MGDVRDKIAQRLRERVENLVWSRYPYLDCTNYSRLDCLCGICSSVLKKLFRQKGYKAKVIYGDFIGNSHCWVESEGWLYDITATQFCKHILDKELRSRVVKLKVGSDLYEKYYDKNKIVRNENVFFDEWPSGQRPISRVVRDMTKNILKRK